MRARMRAPRARARASRSTTNIAAPSPITSPSRRRSNGRHASSSSRGEGAPSRHMPPRPSGLIIASAAPHTTTSSAPRSIERGRVGHREGARGTGRGVDRRRTAQPEPRVDGARGQVDGRAEPNARAPLAVPGDVAVRVDAAEVLEQRLLEPEREHQRRTSLGLAAARMRPRLVRGHEAPRDLAVAQRTRCTELRGQRGLADRVPEPRRIDARHWHLARDARGERARIERANPRDAAGPRGEPVEQRARAEPEGADGADPGDHRRHVGTSRDSSTTPGSPSTPSDTTSARRVPGARIERSSPRRRSPRTPRSPPASRRSRRCG